jgi:hypothetical protein
MIDYADFIGIGDAAASLAGSFAYEGNQSGFSDIQ